MNQRPHHNTTERKAKNFVQETKRKWTRDFSLVSRDSLRNQGNASFVETGSSTESWDVRLVSSGAPQLPFCQTRQKVVSANWEA